MKFPKIIHQVWVGEKSFPEKDFRWACTIRNTNPDWKFVLHAEHPDRMPKSGPWNEIRLLPDLRMAPLAEAIRHRMSPKRFPAALADIVRIEVLLNEGGVYFDTDVVGLRAIEPVVQNMSLGLSWEFSQNQLGNFFIAAQKDHPALYATLNSIHVVTMGAIKACHDLNPFWITGPKVIEHTFPAYPDFIALPYTVMSPWDPKLPFPEDFAKINFSERSVVAHLFDSKWTYLPRDPSIPLEQGLILDIEDGHCRDSEGRWCPDPDGHYDWRCTRNVEPGGEPIDYSHFRDKE